jgi:hypothetical protein
MKLTACDDGLKGMKAEIVRSVGWWVGAVFCLCDVRLSDQMQESAEFGILGVEKR